MATSEVIPLLDLNELDSDVRSEPAHNYRIRNRNPFRNPFRQRNRPNRVNTNTRTNQLEEVAIDLEEGAETVLPLSAGLTVPETGAVVTGGIFGGIALGKTLEYIADRGAVLPGHKYIGPGNPSNLGAPVDVDDLIAAKHDLLYQTAKRKSDIVKADAEAINSFSADFQETGNLHSLIGQAGIQVKSGIEKITGVLYPTGT
jgi:hypothetical protein